MLQVADLHIHSKYSRACSRQLTLANIDFVCRQKGINIIATGDFCFPQWFDSINSELEEIDQSGLYRLKEKNNNQLKFILSTEISLIYKKFDRARRIHIVLHAPNIQAVHELNTWLDKKYNIRSDGRPILGMDAEKLAEICLSIHPDFLIYPAHIWTPWFSLFGSKSGFDKLEECFGKWTNKIYAYETGLSSDPEMNWRISALDKLTLLSNSDAHSLPNLGREANVFDLKNPSYSEIFNIIKNNITKNSLSPKKQQKQAFLSHTIEFYPEEGMYHYDGHRDCQISLSPKESKKNKGICPKCGKALTIGVMNRVEELSDRDEGIKPKNANDYIKLIELDKIIAESYGIKSRFAKKVTKTYQMMINTLGTELDILQKLDLSDIAATGSKLIAKGIARAREGKLIIKPGFDGQYGSIKIFKDEEKIRQKSLF